ncbi:hypothetical protein RFI_34616 [Reticulomyxa filosa]|uniref:Uncharacterized protein n=1 Tax=Reticulomyxa filosa TaxID=46433 RepID=X6LPY4_RETFI|nr:hypothetical protein RFI_34616 [Reticulomyxa filosa]|eukprot:ETO02800.1 hypothetical protein RFI_34616 [Reticulomyxa filosa]
MTKTEDISTRENALSRPEMNPDIIMDMAPLSQHANANKTVSFAPLPRVSLRQEDNPASPRHEGNPTSVRQESVRSEEAFSHRSRFAEALEEELQHGTLSFGFNNINVYVFALVTTKHIHSLYTFGLCFWAIFCSIVFNAEKNNGVSANPNVSYTKLHLPRISTTRALPNRDELKEKPQDAETELDKMLHLNVATKRKQSSSRTATRINYQNAVRSLSIFFFPGNMTISPLQKAMSDYQNKNKNFDEALPETVVLSILDALDGCLLSVFKNMRKPFQRFLATAISLFFVCVYIVFITTAMIKKPFIRWAETQSASQPTDDVQTISIVTLK